MAKQFLAIDDAHAAFIAAQHIFFVGTAAPTGQVNISPKGMDSLRVLGPNRVIWRNLTGSGNETAGHLQRLNRMTLMWCSFDTRPLILRLYGTARTLHAGATEFATLDAHFIPDPGARQIYDMTVGLVQTSCGYAVPFYDHKGPRDTLTRWAEDKDKTEGGISRYWDERNRSTIDGFDTGIAP